MRRLAALLVLVAAGLSHAQTQAWEKLIAPGLTYRMEIDLQKPLVIHALRWTSGSGAIRARVETAKDTILAPADVDTVRGRDLVTNAIRRTQAIAGINGDFFPLQGNPMGCMLRDGELIALPTPDRSAFGWGPGAAEVGTLTGSGTAKLPSGEVPLKSLNKEAGDNDLVLQTNVAGYSLSKSTGTHVIFSASGFLRPGVDSAGTVKRVEQNQTAVRLGADEWALTGTGSRIAALNSLKPGDQVSVNLSLTGLDLLKIRNIVGGGPGLLHNGTATIDVVKEQFSNSFALDRHPRTAVGFNRDGDVWMVVIDGRQPNSRGASLPELADIMLGLGCTD
ncbi:MAG: phosphodiester glycosidase family protein, partial [Armatimonadota bacterium]